MNNEQLEREFEVWYTDNRPLPQLFSITVPRELAESSIKAWAKHAFIKGAVLAAQEVSKRLGV